MTTCPCCHGDNTRAHEGRVKAQFCGSCGHRWRLGAAAAEYGAQSERTIVRGDHLERRIAERIAFVGPVPACSRVLEVGCAEGYFAREFRRVSPGIFMVGLEPSADSVAAAGVLDEVHRAGLQEFELQAQSGTFDLVLAFHVLEHLEDPVVACTRLSRLARSGGRIVIEVPHGSGNRSLPEDANPEHLHFFTVASISCALARAGLVVDEAVTGGFESPVYPDSIRVRATHRARYDDLAHDWRSRLQFLLGEQGAIWGVGGDFRNYVLPYLAPDQQCLVVDSDSRNHGRVIEGRTVAKPTDLLKLNGNVLVASYRFEREIRHSLQQLGVGPERIRTLGDLSDPR